MASATPSNPNNIKRFLNGDKTNLAARLFESANSRYAQPNEPQQGRPPLFGKKKKKDGDEEDTSTQYDSDGNTYFFKAIAAIRAASSSVVSVKKSNKASCLGLILSVQSFERNDAGSSTDKVNKNITLCFIKVINPAKNIYGEILTTTDGSMLLLQTASLYWPEKTISDTDDTYRNAQLVLGFLHSMRQAAFDKLKEKGKELYDADKNFSGEMNVVPQILMQAACSYTAKKSYLVHCQLGNVPYSLMNRKPPNNGTVPRDISKTYVEKPSSPVVWEEESVRHLKNPKVANLVVYIIYFLKCLQTTKSNPIKLKSECQLDIRVAKDVKIEPNSMVVISDIESNISFNPLLVKFDSDGEVIPISPGMFAPSIKVGSCSVYSSYPEPLHPGAMLQLAVTDGIGLYSNELLTIEQLGVRHSINYQEQRDAKIKKALDRGKNAKNVDVYLPISFFVHQRGTIDNLSRYLASPAEFPSASIMTLEPVNVDPGSDENPYCTKNKNKGKPNEPSTSRIRVIMNVCGFQWKRPILVKEARSVDGNTRNIASGISSQTMDGDEMEDDDNKYRIYYEELERVAGLARSNEKSLSFFGVEPASITTWTPLASTLFKFINGFVSGSVQWGESEELKNTVRALELSDEDRAFLDNHRIVDNSDQRKYMLVSNQEDYDRAIAITINMAEPKIVYNALIKEWVIDYASLIKSIGMPVSQRTAEQYLEKPAPNPKELKFFPQGTYKSSGGVFIIGDKSQFPKDATAFSYYILYTDLLKGEEASYTTFLSAIQGLTPQMSDVVYNSMKGKKTKDEISELCKKHGIPDDAIFDFRKDFVRNATTYLFAVPNDHETKVNNDANKFRKEVEAVERDIAALNLKNGDPQLEQETTGGVATTVATNGDKPSRPASPVTNGGAAAAATATATTAEPTNKKNKKPSTEADNMDVDEPAPETTNEVSFDAGLESQVDSTMAFTEDSNMAEAAQSKNGAKASSATKTKAPPKGGKRKGQQQQEEEEPSENEKKRKRASSKHQVAEEEEESFGSTQQPDDDDDSKKSKETQRKRRRVAGADQLSSE